MPGLKESRPVAMDLARAQIRPELFEGGCAAIYQLEDLPAPAGCRERLPRGVLEGGGNATPSSTIPSE